MTAETVGELVVQRINSPGGVADSLKVLHADPIARISAELLQEISILTVRGEDRWSSLVDDILTIKADNRTVVYVIDFASYDSATDSYLMRWPD